MAGSLAGRRREPLPAAVRQVWGALRLPGAVAGERMAAAGRLLAGALLAGTISSCWPGCLTALTPGDTAEVVLSAAGEALALPVELIRLRTAAGGEAGRWG